MVDGKGVLHMIYFSGDHSHGDLCYVRSVDQGTTFSSALKVNSCPAAPFRAGGNIRGAHIALGRYGRPEVGEEVDGIDVHVAQSVIAELGVDVPAFPSEKHITNWLGLCPTNETSGTVLKCQTPKVVSRAKLAFRQAASTLLRSQNYLGAQYRRLRTRLGAPKVIMAVARKPACLFYWLLKHGKQYVDKGVEFSESKYREQQIRFVTKDSSTWPASLQPVDKSSPAEPCAFWKYIAIPAQAHLAKVIVLRSDMAAPRTRLVMKRPSAGKPGPEPQRDGRS
jgi:hypothetical protein